MTLTIDLSAETQQKLETLAAVRGQDVPGFVHELIERVAQAAEHMEKEKRASHIAGLGNALNEVLRPVREEFETSGMTEEELTHFLTDLRDEVRREKRSRKVS